ncbi:MAG: hypothetical protein IK141_05440 [Clostridia bacterium]|nr:hypothetical protein [Clostridia bacterium]
MANGGWFPPGFPARGRQFRSLKGDASAFLHSYGLTAKGKLPFKPALCGRTIGTRLSVPPDCRTYSTEVTRFRGNLRLHRGLFSANRHTAPFKALYHHISRGAKSQGFFTKFQKFFCEKPPKKTGPISCVFLADFATKSCDFKIFSFYQTNVCFFALAVLYWI